MKLELILHYSHRYGYWMSSGGEPLFCHGAGHEAFSLDHEVHYQLTASEEKLPKSVKIKFVNRTDGYRCYVKKWWCPFSFLLGELPYFSQKQLMNFPSSEKKRFNLWIAVESI